MLEAATGNVVHTLSISSVNSVCTFGSGVKVSGWELCLNAEGPVFSCSVANSKVSTSLSKDKKIKEKAVIEADRWYRVGADYDGEVLRVLVDGVVVGEKKQSLEKPLSNNTNELQVAKSVLNNASSALNLKSVRLMNKTFSVCVDSSCALASVSGYNLCDEHLKGIVRLPSPIRLLTYSLCAVDVTFAYLNYFHKIGLLDLLSNETIFPGAKTGTFDEQKMAQQVHSACTLVATLPPESGFTAWSLLRMIGYISTRPEVPVRLLQNSKKKQVKPVLVQE